MPFNFKIHLLLVLLFCFSFEILAQDISSIGKEKPLKINGGMSLSQMLYYSNDSIRRRNPYNWVATGNLNLSIYGWSIPFSYTISNYEHSYQQPFNNYCMNPTYKWITLHVGYCNMSYSPYTLSGHSFLGAGVDLAPPGIFKFSVMFGRLLRAIEPDTTNPNIAPAYERIGYGFKTGIAKDKNSIELIVFKATDIKNSLTSPLADSLLKPKDNLTLSLGGKASIAKNLVLNAEIAGSALTDNLNDPGVADKSVGKLYSATGLYKVRSSSAYYKAWKAGLNYSIGKSAAGIAYERIDPGYQTLGTYYSNNDYENYTVNVSTQVFTKLNLSLSAGIQQDDLDMKKSSDTRRFVSSVNLTYSVNSKLNINTSYSGFQTYTRVKSQFDDINRVDPYQYIDTLTYTQLTNSFNTNISYNLARTETSQKFLNFNLSYQKASDKQSSQNSGSDFINSNISYSYVMIPIGLTTSASINACDVNAPGANSLTLGPSVSISKNLLNKTLRPSVSFSVNQSYNNGKFVNSSYISRLMGNYKIKKKHNLNLSLVFAKIDNKILSKTTIRKEFTGTLGYSYNF